MDARQLAQQHAAARAALGAALALAPGLAARAWVGSAAATPGARVIATGMGARDVAIAGGALRGLRTGSGARGWILAGVVGDTADLVATLRAREALPTVAVAGISAMAAGSAVLGVWLARELG